LLSTISTMLPIGVSTWSVRMIVLMSVNLANLRGGTTRKTARY
jgi:hypothetical protein